MHRSSTSDAKHKVTRSTPTCSHVGTDSLPHYHAPITFLAFKYKYLHLSLLIIIFIFSISNKISLNKNLILLYHLFFLNKKNISIFLFQKNIPFPTTSFSTATTFPFIRYSILLLSFSHSNCSNLFKSKH